MTTFYFYVTDIGAAGGQYISILAPDLATARSWVYSQDYDSTRPATAAEAGGQDTYVGSVDADGSYTPAAGQIGQPGAGAGDGAGDGAGPGVPDADMPSYLERQAAYQAQFEQALGLPAFGRYGYQRYMAERGPRDVQAWELEQALRQRDVEAGAGPTAPPRTYAEYLGQRQPGSMPGTIPAAYMNRLGAMTPLEEQELYRYLPEGGAPDLRATQFESAYGIPATGRSGFQGWQAEQAPQDQLAWALNQLLMQGGYREGSQQSYGQVLGSRLQQQGPAMPDRANAQWLHQLTAMDPQAERELYDLLSTDYDLDPWAARQFAATSALRSRGVPLYLANRVASRYFSPEEVGAWQISPEAAAGGSYLRYAQGRMGL